MSMLSLTRVGLMAATLLVAAGCATTTSTRKLYEGPDRPDTEIASVMVPYTIEIKDINGTDPSNLLTVRNTKEQRLTLLPGSYVFGVRFSSPFEFGVERTGLTTLRSEHRADLEAGHVYRFMSRVRGNDSTAEVDLWMEDVGLKARVDVVPPPPTPKPIAPIPTPKEETIVVKPTPAVESDPKDAATLPAGSASDDLKRAWQTATPDERTEFLKSIVSP